MTKWFSHRIKWNNSNLQIYSVAYVEMNTSGYRRFDWKCFHWKSQWDGIAVDTVSHEVEKNKKKTFDNKDIKSETL